MNRWLSFTVAVAGAAGLVAACSSSNIPAGQDNSNQLNGQIDSGNGLCGSAACAAGQLCCEGPDPACTPTCMTVTQCPVHGSPCQGTGGCAGSAPNCFGNDSQTCCGQDPSGPAVCENGAWMCGGAAAPGCNGTSCLQPTDGGTDSGADSSDGGCTGSAPPCFGNNSQGCCGQDPSGLATCQSGTWMCGSAVAPGCNGVSCLFPDGGPG